MADRYVDFSATNDGDGTSASQAGSPGVAGAWNNLTNSRFGTLSTGDKVWIRRVSFSSFPGIQCAFSQGMGLTPVGFRYFIGWPAVGDVDYSVRPASGISAGWDSDGQTYAEFRSTDTSALPFDGFGCALRRLKLSHNLSSNSANGRVVRAYEMRNCYALSLVTNNANWSIVTGDTATWTRSGTQVTTGGYFANCLFEARGAVSAVTSNNPCDFVDCTFQRIVTFNSSASVAILGAGCFSRCTFVDNSTGSSAPCVKLDPNGATLPAGYPGPMLVGCTVDNSLATVNLNYALEVNMRALVRNLTLLGTGILHQAASCPPMHVTTLTQSLAGAYGVQCLNPCTIRLADATFKTNTTSDVGLGDECILFLVNAKFNVGTADTRITSSGVRYAIYTMDEGSVLGAWKQHGPNGTVTKNSSVARTGGEVLSLQFFQKEVLGSYYAPLETGGIPGFETLFVNLNAGPNTITAYLAVKNWDATLYPVDADTAWIELDYMDGATGHVVTASSKIQGALASDGSTWTGDGSVTALKMSLSVSPTQGQVAPLRLYFNKPSPASNPAYYAYVDPKVVVS